MTDRPIKGQNLITPGYDALSDACGGCEKYYSTPGPDKGVCHEFGVKLTIFHGGWKRCQACKDSEVNIELLKRIIESLKRVPSCSTVNKSILATDAAMALEYMFGLNETKGVSLEALFEMFNFEKNPPTEEEVNASLEGVGEADLPVCPTCKVAGDDELDLFLIGMSDHEWDGNGECPTCHRLKTMPNLTDFPSFAKYVREGAEVEARIYSDVWEPVKFHSFHEGDEYPVHIVRRGGVTQCRTRLLRTPQDQMKLNKGVSWCKENVNLEAWRGDR